MGQKLKSAENQKKLDGFSTVVVKDLQFKSEVSINNILRHCINF